MSSFAWLELALFVALLLVLARPLGLYMARVFGGEVTRIDRLAKPLERALYRLGGVDPNRQMNWKAYGLALLALQVIGIALVYALQRFQSSLPLNPQGLPAVRPDLAFNTAVSFVTNTNWQAYGGETTLSHLVQLAGLTVQNFVSAATGMAVLAAFLRAFRPEPDERLGNFWVDVTRATVYVLLPLAVLLSLALVSQGVVQTFEANPNVALLDVAQGGREQAVALGPAASQVAIKQLGTNGGGFFNVNSAHPLENPTPLSNLLQLLAILLIPTACCFQFGRAVMDMRQGRALLAAMFALFLPFAALAIACESHAGPAFDSPALDSVASELQPGGNMEGKELRFGTRESALWAAATTAASNGSVNSMHDSFTPLGGLAPLFLMQLGEVAFGGVGSGLYGMLLFALVAVFLAGLMVGRTPEYLGKKLGAFEMQMASIAILLPSVVVLAGTALGVGTEAGRASLQDRGTHGFSEVLYAFTSAGNNNGSAFAGLNAATPLYDLALGVAMLIGRFGVALPVLAIAGSFAQRRAVPPGPGTLPTHGALFVALLVAVVLLVGALNFVPALALGPIAEQLRMVSHVR